MIDIRLQKLSLKNFKGIKEYSIDFNGQNTTVSGMNATGKSTIVDSWNWLLFDKDSTNRKDFSIKPQDKDGNDIHFLETEVEGIISVDGKQLKLRKMFTEKWVKKRGQQEQEFSGHETLYWVDDVPFKKNEYQTKINSIINEGIFKLLTNPFYFNTQLKWEERRKILLGISGDISDEDVILSDNNLVKLTTILDGKSIDDYKKILAERIKKLNQEIEKIPIRIDETSKSLPLSEVDYSEAESELKQYKDRLVIVETEQMDATKAADSYRQKHQALSDLQALISKRKITLDELANAGWKEITDEKNALDKEKYRLEQDSQGSGDRLMLMTQGIADIDKEILELRGKWHTENKNELTLSEDEFICPICKRPLPENEQESKITELKTNFTNNKKAELEKITSRGKLLATRKNDLVENITNINEQIFKNEVKTREINERITEIDQELSNNTEVKVNYLSDAEYQKLTQELQIVQNELDKPVEDSGTELLQKKQQLAKQINELNRILNQRELTEKIKARIDELKAEEKRLAQQISELDGHRYLIEQFTKAKVNLLEESINSRFKMVKFRLFDTQINGGIVETCITLIDGVPFEDANNASRVNAGMEIISVFSNHYGVNAPIFQDNAESVVNLLEIGSQVIRLFVSGKDKVLSVVYA